MKIEIIHKQKIQIFYKVIQQMHFKKKKKIFKDYKCKKLQIKLNKMKINKEKLNI